MQIRQAVEKDIPVLLDLLAEIGQFHQVRRPDIFRADAQKYDASNLTALLSDLTRPIVVAVSDADEVLGYAMCQFKESVASDVLRPYKILYLDDLCVAGNGRRQGVGGALLEYCKDLARRQKCARIELNVWEFPDSALEFYETHGFTTQKRELEFWISKSH